MVTVKHNYEFELVYKLAPGEDPAQYIDALFEAGCDDAIPLIGQPGMIGLAFDRESTSASMAVASAIVQVEKAIPHATIDKLERVEPWLKNLSELAVEFGCTKQNLSRYQRGESSVAEPFPAPYVDGRTSYWITYVVADWLQRNANLEVPKEKMDMYKCAWVMNMSILRYHCPDEFREVEEMFDIAC